MVKESLVAAWNRFVMSSRPGDYAPGSERRAAAIANLFMGLANNGGINSFLTCANDLDGSEVLEALVSVGALKAAKQFGTVLRGLGTPVPVATQAERFYLLQERWSKALNGFDVLSKEADEELMAVLERHVSESEAFYLTLPKHWLDDWDGE